MEDRAYFKENLTEKEKELIKPFFTNTETNVFALINLPEVIKGTLFSRYSRSDKGARRLLLDEFMPNKDVVAAIESNATAALSSALAVNKAEDFYQRILVGYGDDSVAELAGIHIACENISSLAGDLITDSRIGISPLEKSARYIPFDKKINDKYLWYREPKIMDSQYAGLYEKTMDSLFSSYAIWLPIVNAYVKEATPKDPTATERAYESATRAKACDVLKNMLTASRLTNVGLFGNGRAFEYLLTKLYSSGLGEGIQLAKEMHEELSKVIPAFVKRSQSSEYIIGTKEGMMAHAKSINGSFEPTTAPYLKLIDYDQDAEIKVLAAMLFPYTNLPITRLREMVKAMSAEEKKKLIEAYLSKRRNRRDKAGRALENTYYTFEICANYGIFRDLHRHRVLSLEKQLLTANLGYDVPKELESLGLKEEYISLMEQAKNAYKEIAKEMPLEAQYVVPRSFHLRWYMKMNLREAHHLTELRSIKQGHPDYRKMAQDMKRLIEDVHPLLVQYMQVDMNEYALPRIESEKKIDGKLATLDQQKAQSSKQS